MITIDYKPVAALSNCRIIFTDSAESEASVLFMDKGDAPDRDSIVWMQIVNQGYNPDDPFNVDEIDGVTDDVDLGNGLERYPLDHSGNRYYAFEQWMWVDQVYSNEFPANYLKDENGDPLTDPVTGELELGDWENTPGLVKVVLYEHKYVLTRQASLDNVNILQRLSYIVNLYNSLLPVKFFNSMDWDDIASFLSVQKIKLDHGIEYVDPDDPPNPLPSEYPPVRPHHCLWKHLRLDECLDDLLRNFESRVISVAAVKPVKEDYIIGGVEDITDDVLTDLRWRRRRRIEHDTSIIYNRIQWPVLTKEALDDEDNSVIYFRNMSANFTNSAGVYLDGLFPEIPTSASRGNNFDNVKRSDLDFICNLYPYAPDYLPDSFTEINDYLRTNHVNMDQYYGFTTRALPSEFYGSAEWSRIELRFVSSLSSLAPDADNYEYLVEHKPRQGWFPADNFSYIFNAYLKGVVESIQENTVKVNTLIDITNNVIIPSSVVLPLEVSTDAVHVNDQITMLISGNTLSLTGVESIYEDTGGEPEIITIKWSGDDIQTITWNIIDWDFEIPDVDLELADPLSLLHILNYTYESHEDLEPDTPTHSFDIIPYEVGEFGGTNIQSPVSKNMAKITFKMRATREELIDYLEASSHLSDLAGQDSFIDAVADYWLRHYERVSLFIGLSHSISRMDMFFTETDFDRLHHNTGITPDLVPGEFFGPSGAAATTFPNTFSGVPAYPSTVITDDLVIRGNGLLTSPLLIKNALWKKYYAYFRSFDTKIALTVVP